MSDEEKQPGDDFMEKAAEIAMEWFDIKPIARALESEYQRGLADGHKDSQAALKAEYDRGADDYRDALLRNLDAGRKPIASGIEEVSGAAGASQGAVGAEPANPPPPPEKRIGGAVIGEKPPSGGVPALRPTTSAKGPKGNRPANIPSNAAMAIEAIKAIGPSGGSAIRNWCRRTYWADMPDTWSGCLYDLVSDGKLRRAGINFALIEEGAAPPVKPPPRPPADAPKPANTLRAPAAATGAIKFEHGGKSVMLSTSREYVLAGKLKAAMGKGHLAEAFLAQAVLGSNTESNRDTIKMAALELNGRLAEIGLKVENYPGYGLMMKDLAG